MLDKVRFQGFMRLDAPRSTRTPAIRTPMMLQVLHYKSEPYEDVQDVCIFCRHNSSAPTAGRWIEDVLAVSPDAPRVRLDVAGVKWTPDLVRVAKSVNLPLERILSSKAARRCILESATSTQYSALPFVHALYLVVENAAGKITAEYVAVSPKGDVIEPSDIFFHDGSEASRWDLRANLDYSMIISGEAHACVEKAWAAIAEELLGSGMVGPSETRADAQSYVQHPVDRSERPT